MEKKYTMCPRCELNYMPIGEKYCDVCKAELGIGEAGFLLPDEEDESEARLCPICHTNYCEDGEDMCIECKKEQAAKGKPYESESDEWVDNEDVSSEIDEEDEIPIIGLDDEEEEEEEDISEQPSEDDFEYINTDDFVDDEDEEEQSEEDDF